MGAKAQLASSAANGGSFESGFLSGALSSAVSSVAGAALSPLSKPLRDVGMVAVGGLTGGLGSVIGGGGFWEGFRQGIITSGLNHVMHAGLEGIAGTKVVDEDRHWIRDGNGKIIGIEVDGVKRNLTKSELERIGHLEIAYQDALVEANDKVNAYSQSTGTNWSMTGGIAGGAIGAGFSIYSSAGTLSVPMTAAGAGLGAWWAYNAGTLWGRWTAPNYAKMAYNAYQKNVNDLLWSMNSK